ARPKERFTGDRLVGNGRATGSHTLWNLSIAGAARQHSGGRGSRDSWGRQTAWGPVVWGHSWNPRAHRPNRRSSADQPVSRGQARARRANCDAPPVPGPGPGRESRAAALAYFDAARKLATACRTTRAADRSDPSGYGGNTGCANFSDGGIATAPNAAHGVTY